MLAGLSWPASLLSPGYNTKPFSMKKNFISSVVVALFAGMMAFIVIRFTSIRHKNETIFYAIHERTGASSKLAEWPLVKHQANLLTCKDQSRSQ